MPAFDDCLRTSKRKLAEITVFGRQDPNQPSLQFKRVHSRERIYSIRVGIGWRALGLWEDEAIYWFWIGSHAEYDKLLNQL